MKNTVFNLFFVFVLFLLTAASCNDGMPATEKAVTHEQDIQVVRPYEDMGDNIFWIKQVGVEFVKALKILLQDHPELKIVDIEGNGTEYNGSNTGFFVFMERK